MRELIDDVKFINHDLAGCAGEERERRFGVRLAPKRCIPNRRSFHANGKEAREEIAFALSASFSANCRKIVVRCHTPACLKARGSREGKPTFVTISFERFICDLRPELF
jgi:hypothetical protein